MEGRREVWTPMTLMFGVRLLDGAGDAADEAAAADGHDDGFEVGDLLEQLEADGSLAGHDGGVVEGVDEGDACSAAQMRRASS